MDHSRAPVLEALEDFKRRGDVSFNPPGHKQGRGIDERVRAVMGDSVFASDILSMNALDDRAMSKGVLAAAQDLMADAVGATHTFFSTCGSSLSVKSAMLAVAGPGEKLLVSRNAHKSVIAAVIINGVEPVWVHPHFDEDLHLVHPPEPQDVRRALEAHPDAKGMLLVTPTDYGTCADIAGVALVCHSHGVPLIVDEAWGAHLPFHSSLPAWGVYAGADLVVTSVHKMGGAIEQSSVFHLRGNRVDPAVLKMREDLLGTTSASVLVYAALDGWRRQMVERGEELLDAALTRAQRVRERIADLPGLDVMGLEVVRPGGAADLDPLKVVVDVSGLGISGYQAADHLHARHHVNVGLADHRRFAAQITHADDDTTITALLDAVTALAEESRDMAPPSPVHLPPSGALELETVMLPRDAFFGPAEQVPRAKAVGRVAAEIISPYPPGAPVIAPGERITAEVLDYLASGPPAGMVLPDAVDSTMETLRVVAE
ncbi:aminotransferase class I/II-fold pyridoxal phosphate-dependent enzyme [Marinactinospora thermotolerans]|uniref:Arginine/lysine/ornithine decarboxylase n=1 Tax=Marinactinospora thermotolerans DSM 45154 TaxID=1122192 RepID=A0A1T4T4R5_9ACTN|nr:aminotransferase class I/II-fold pyridoxal phosphate-dependent enzyme [Marinactinospora thermotolerans]SKA35432.1 Arginine/lysine/ornithine decarboxylase [Marinactinospora thermotolerans DSM 45154]